MQTFITIKLQVEGIHRWEECPIEEVDYLRVDHRHVFHMELMKEVFHDDRDREFVQFKHQVQQAFQDKYYDDKYKCCYFGKMSCEMIAKELVLEFNLKSASVSEDNENGAVVFA